MEHFEQLSQRQLSSLWLGMGSLRPSCDHSDYSFEPMCALRGGKPGI